MSPFYGQACRQCGGKMKPGIALQNTVRRDISDFSCRETADSTGQTFSYDGSVKLINCLKCEDCGRSITIDKQK